MAVNNGIGLHRGVMHRSTTDVTWRRDRRRWTGALRALPGHTTFTEGMDVAVQSRRRHRRQVGDAYSISAAKGQSRGTAMAYHHSGRDSA